MKLKDIAKAAGVSTSTVSRVLNDKDTKAASKEVKNRIWEIVRETGFVPNENAQNLRRSGLSQKRDTDGKHYYAMIYSRSQDNKDMFFSELASSIEREAYKKDYILKCFLLRGGFGRERLYIHTEGIQDQRAGGAGTLRSGMAEDHRGGAEERRLCGAQSYRQQA